MTSDRPSAAARSLAAVALAALAALAAPRAARAQSATDEARAHFRRGVALYDSGDAAAALDEFRRTLALADSPNARLYLARALREGGMLVEALAAYEATEQQAASRASREPRFAPTAAAARAELAAIERAVGRVVVAPPQGAPEYAVSVAGRAVAPASAASEGVAVMPGRVAVVVTAPGRRDDRRELEVRAGDRLRVDAVLAAEPAAAVAPAAGAAAASTLPAAPSAPPPAPAAAASALAVAPLRGALLRPSRRAATRGDDGGGAAEATVAWLTGGTGVVALLFGGIGLYTAGQTQHAIATGCLSAGRCPSLDPATAAADAQRLATASTVGLIGGGLALGVGVFVGVLGATRGTSPERAAVRVAVAPDGVAVRGTF